MKGRALKEQQESVRRSLWASLFLVVPVMSTTFASTARLFGPLGREQLGWLLIDEAGQAVPQAAIGALWRAKRAIVIGDPLQIQPVVTTSPKLIQAIFSEFGVNTEEWAAPEMSAQTLADRASWFGTDILTDDGDIWVGSPLRVHRRCENPMFKISNHVAYNGLMVYGTSRGTSPIGKVLGESHWINVEGDAVGKWSETEGKYALNLLRKLLDEGINDPDIFFITPFRIVANKLREMIRSDHSIADRLAGNIWEWTQNRVGTVHTFQGKEADTVVIVLGAPLDTSAGARRWAGDPPNLLNVAVTRAKRRLYVIGKRNAWKNAGSFSHLAQMLPVDS
jgi:superfamily I DNA and/or RNA helicase